MTLHETLAPTRPFPLSHRWWPSVLAVVLLVVCSGANCTSRLRGPLALTTPPAPAVLTPAATVEQIVAAVNDNTSRIRSYVTNNASISVPGAPGLPLLRGNIALERPRRLRLRAGTALTGAEVDLGSNDELYWIWSKRNEPPAVYFARHAEHAGSAAQQQLPIDPEWLVDALGLVTLDSAVAYQGPLPRPDGTLELRSVEQTPLGQRQRVYVIDQTRAWVVEQHAYDSAGALLASARASDFRYDEVSQTSLPRRVTVDVPAAGLALVINTGAVVVNSPIANPAELFGLPMFEGYPQVDLGRSTSLPLAATPTGPAFVAEQQAFRADPTRATPIEEGPAAISEGSASRPRLGRLPSGGTPLLQ